MPSKKASAPRCAAAVSPPSQAPPRREPAGVRWRLRARRDDCGRCGPDARRWYPKARRPRPAGSECSVPVPVPVPVPTPVDGDGDGPGRRCAQTTSSLPCGAAGTEEPGDLARRGGEAQVVDGEDRADPLAQTAGLDHLKGRRDVPRPATRAVVMRGARRAA
jgi:hypothetical protein